MVQPRTTGSSRGLGSSFRLAAFAASMVLFTISGIVYADDAPPASAGPTDGMSIKIVQPGTFEIHSREAELRSILTLLATQGHKNIVATKEVTGKVPFLDLQGVTFKEALEAVLHSTGYVYEEKGEFVYVYTPEQYEKITKAKRKMLVQNFRLHYITATDARTLLAPALSTEGTIAITPVATIGIPSSKTDTGGNGYATDDVLVVRDYEEQMARIAKLVQELDSRPQQVLIEATVLRATLNESNALGIDFNMLAGLNFESTNATGTSGVDNMTPGAMTSENLRDIATGAGVRTDFAAGVPGGGMSLGFISNQIAFFIRALESVTPTTVLANPKLLVVNKQRGEVLVGNRDGYITTTVTETVATQTVAFLETGTRLIVRPFIGEDGFIRMEIHPEDSSGSVSQVGNNALPSQTTTEVTSNLLVRDGHTIVIGGLFRERTVAGRSQVPLLGNIPGLGTLFRRTSDSTLREEVIILITPRIIKQENDEAVGGMLKDDIERFRVGARKGMQWWGRARLAQIYMRWARQEANEGELDKAQWNVDMALSLDPQMADAITLKEQITRKAYWSDEVRESNCEYMLQQMIMHELGKPLSEVVLPNRPINPGDLDANVRKAFGLQERLYPPPPRQMSEQVKPQVESVDSIPVSPPATTQPADTEVK